MARRLSPEARRAEIIDVAHAAIVEEGFRGLSLREVARRCGMSAPGLMHYFPDMQSLLEAVLAHRDEVDIAAMGGFAGDRSLTEMIDTAARYYELRTAEMVRFDALEAEALDPNHPAHAWFAERNARNLELMRPTVERDYEDPDTTMRLLGYFVEGMRANWIRDPEHADFAADWEALRRLLDGLPGRRVPAASVDSD